MLTRDQICTAFGWMSGGETGEGGEWEEVLAKLVNSDFPEAFSKTLNDPELQQHLFMSSGGPRGTQDPSHIIWPVSMSLTLWTTILAIIDSALANAVIEPGIKLEVIKARHTLHEGLGEYGSHIPQDGMPPPRV